MRKDDLEHLGAVIGRQRSRLGTAVVEVRVAAASLVLLLAHGAALIRLPQWVDGVLQGYIALNLILLVILRKRLHQKRMRILPELLDIVAISLLVAATGELKSAWFVLYLFPVMSAARFMGGVGIFALASFAGVGYGFATSILNIGNEGASLLSFILRVLTLGGVSLTAANLARARDKGEAELVDAIERIDRLILADGDNDRVLRLILKTALKLTESDVCSMILVEGSRVTATFAEATTPTGTAPGAVEREKAAACRILQERFRHHALTKQPLALPQRSFFSTVAGALRMRAGDKLLPGRLVSLEIDHVRIGVFGVFTRRRFHYFTTNDLRRLASLAPLVAMTQKNAKLFRESRGRLELLYRIGRRLKEEYGLGEVFQVVVDLVRDQLGSEEAALFLRDEKGEALEKKAVSGPDAETTECLREIERSYGPGQKSLTREVFDRKEPGLHNDIELGEVFADEYSRALPSAMTLHYLGVPLIIGDEVLGVIRVLNKKALDYEPKTGSARLALEGFRDDDLQLLTFIATQIAAAIRSAKFVEQKRYFENLVYTSPDPTIVVDNKGRVRNFNRACEEIWRRREQEVLGLDVAEFYPSLEHAKGIRHQLRNEPSKVLRDFPTEIRGPDGERIPIRLSAALLVDYKGEALGSIGIFRDQRPILLLEEERIRTEKLAALGRLAQTASHDIKHDLGAILGFLPPLERKLRGDVDAAIAVRSIATAAEEALDKIQRMLLAARPKAPERQELSIKRELESFRQSVQQRAAATQVEFALVVPEEDVLISADVELLRQVFANLFGNSLDAIRLARDSDPERRSHAIAAVLENTEDGAILSWRDDGCGMSAEVLSRAFTAFYTTKEGGSGLGLSVTKTIIENHGGEIAIDSEEGVGTTMRITLLRLPAGVGPTTRPSVFEAEGGRP